MSSIQIVPAIVLSLLLMVFIMRKFLKAKVASNSDAMVINQLKKAGSNLETAHAIEFFLYFNSETAARRISDQLLNRGYSTEVSPSASNATVWLVTATLEMVPNLNNLMSVRHDLTTLADSESGIYDGWGTTLVK